MKSIILICGLPGTGKTSLAAKLIKALPDFILIDQTQVRRRFGEKNIPARERDGDSKSLDCAVRKIDRMIGEAFRSGQDIIYESANRFSSRRHQVYGIASSWDAEVLVLEAVCPEEIAKARMKKRPEGDNLLSDPNNPAVYDKHKREWQNVLEVDYDAGLSYVSYARYDSSQNRFQVVVERDEARNLISKIKQILTK